MAKSKAKKVGLYIFYGILTVCLLITILSFGDLGEIFKQLQMSNVKYILIAIACILVYAALYPLTTCILAKAQKLNVGFGTTYSIAMTEHFFNGITPFATGGQPFQVYAFTKAKVKASDATSLLMMNFIIFMIVTNGFALTSLIYYSKFATELPIQILAIVGFTMNFGVLAFLIALATSKRLGNALLKLAKLLCKIKWIGKLFEPKIPELAAYIERAQSGFKGLIKQGWAALVCLLIKIVTMGAFYAATFYILRALHVAVEYSDMFFVICGSSFAITMVVFIPTPGSSGGIEFAFQRVFASLAGGAAVAVSYSGMLIWRLLSYYMMLVISLVFYIGLEIYFAHKAKVVHDYETVAPEEPTPLPLCYSGNKRVFEGLTLSVLSVLKMTPRAINVYVLTMDLTEENPSFEAISDAQIETLNTIVKEYNPDNAVIKLDATEEFKREFSKSKNKKTNYTPYSMLRLLLDYFDVPEKLLYLDVDTMCCSDLSQLYDIDLGDSEFAASRDVVGSHWVRLGFAPNYCNSGVLLMNVAKMKETGLFRKTRKRVLKRRMFMPDQSALNFLCTKKTVLPYRFNEQRKIKPDTVVKHFCKGFKWYGPFFTLYNYKQWDRTNVHEKLNIHDFDDLYELYDGYAERFEFEKL